MFVVGEGKFCIFDFGVFENVLRLDCEVFVIEYFGMDEINEVVCVVV